MSPALGTDITQQLLGMARGDLGRARKSRDKSHMITATKQGTIEIHNTGYAYYEIVKLGDMAGPGVELFKGSAADVAVYIVDSLYDIQFAD